MTRNEKLLAVVPLPLPWLGSLLSWGWISLGWPTPPHLDAPPTMVTDLLPLIGAVAGFRRGVPLWSYSWIALAVAGVFSLAFGVTTTIISAEEARYSLMLTSLVMTIPNFLHLVVVLAITYVLSARNGLRHGLAFCVLGFVALITAFPPTTSALMQWSILKALVASAGLIAFVQATYRFLSTISTSLKLFGFLVTTTLIVTYISSVLSFFAADFDNEGLVAYWTGLMGWAYVLVMLLLAWFASWLGERRNRRLAGS